MPSVVPREWRRTASSSTMRSTRSSGRTSAFKAHPASLRLRRREGSRDFSRRRNLAEPGFAVGARGKKRSPSYGPSGIPAASPP